MQQNLNSNRKSSQYAVQLFKKSLHHSFTMQLSKILKPAMKTTNGLLVMMMMRIPRPCFGRPSGKESK